VVQLAGDEVYGSCTQLREHFEATGQAYVLRVPSNFMIALVAGTKLTCAQAVARLLRLSPAWPGTGSQETGACRGVRSGVNLLRPKA